MYPTRTVYRVPSTACRVARATPSTARSFSYVPQPFFPRFHSPFASSGADFAPLFRLFDDIATPTFRHIRTPSYQPRFDVEEVEGAYNVRGEIPGIEGKDLSVEFTDPQTLVIKGSTEKAYTSDTPSAQASEQQDATMTNAAPAPAETTEAAAANDNSDAESTHSTGSYVQATVEDDPEEPSTSGQATPAESTTNATAAQEQTTEQAVAETQKTEAPAQQQKPRYWVSERSTGSFQRSFKFSSRIDQNNVSASLKNGILEIVVPKAAIPAPRRINVE